MDENEASEVMAFIKHESNMAGHVWGDMYRNTFLNRVRDPPAELSPSPGNADQSPRFHPSVNKNQLRESRLWSSYRFEN